MLLRSYEPVLLDHENYKSSLTHKIMKASQDKVTISLAARATSAAPTFFPEVTFPAQQAFSKLSAEEKKKNLVFWDGGLLNNLPVEPLLGQPDLRVVGVHCNPINTEARIPTFRRLIERTLHLAINANTAARKAQCHLLLEPPELRHYRPLGYKRGPELFDIGYRYTMGQAAALVALL